MSDTAFQLGPWTVSPARRRIERADESVQLTPRGMAVLERLAAAGGDVVTRDELHDSVWRGGAVSDDALTQCIVELRKALGDSAREPRFIETIPKRGFRLIERVSATAPAVPERAVGRHAGILAIGAVLVLAAALAFFSLDRAAPVPVAQPASVAVMPFEDLSPEGDQAYFADGLAEEIIGRLAGVEDLLVIGRTSSFRFRDSGDDLPAIGRALGVGHILEGSVRLSPAGFRVSARLVEAATGFEVWADTFDRPIEDIFEVQGDIADAVAGALSYRLGVSGDGRLPGGTRNVEAYRAVMRAREAGHKLTVDNYHDVLGHYRAATRIDPNYAYAWAKLATTYRMGRFYFNDLIAWEEPAIAAIERALELSPGTSSIAAQAALLYGDLGRWSDAQAALLTVESGVDIDIDLAHIDLLAKTGRITDALVLVRRLLPREPLGGFVAKFNGHLYASLARSEEALRELDRGYALGGHNNFMVYEGLVVAMALDDRALLEKWLDRAIEWEADVPGNRSVLAIMKRHLDRPDDAREWLRQVYEGREAPDYWIAVWAAYFDAPELSLAVLDRTPDLWSLWMPVMSNVRQHPDFPAFAVKHGLLEYWQRYGWSDACRPAGDDSLVCR